MKKAQVRHKNSIGNEWLPLLLFVRDSRQLALLRHDSSTVAVLVETLRMQHKCMRSNILYEEKKNAAVSTKTFPYFLHGGLPPASCMVECKGAVFVYLKDGEINLLWL